MMMSEVKSSKRHRVESTGLTGPLSSGRESLANSNSKPRRTVTFSSTECTKSSTCNRPCCKDELLVDSDMLCSSVHAKPLKSILRASNKKKSSKTRADVIAECSANSIASVGVKAPKVPQILSELWDTHEAKLYSLRESSARENCRVSRKGGTLQSMSEQLQFSRHSEENSNIEVEDLRVIIDSGASSHMFPNREVFYILHEFAEKNRQTVMFGGGETAPICGIGDTCLVKGALYIPKLTTGVISVSKLDRAGYMTIASDSTMEVEVFETGETVMVGALQDGNCLYELTDVYKRMLCDTDCRVYPTEVNPDILDEDGNWIQQVDSGSDTSSDESSDYGPDEESKSTDDDAEKEDDDNDEDYARRGFEWTPLRDEDEFKMFINMNLSIPIRNGCLKTLMK